VQLGGIRCQRTDASSQASTVAVGAYGVRVGFSHAQSNVRRCARLRVFFLTLYTIAVVSTTNYDLNR